MPATAAEQRLLLQTADSLVRDSRGMAVLGWPLDLRVRAVVAAEELADLATAQDRTDLQPVAMDLFTLLVGIEEIAQPRPAHAEQLQRLADTLAALVADGDRGAGAIDLLAEGEPPDTLLKMFADAGFTLRRHDGERTLAEANRRQPAAAWLVDVDRLPAVGALLDDLSRELPAAGAIVVFALGDRVERLQALLQGAEDHAASLQQHDLGDRVLERLQPEKEAAYRVLVVDDEPQSRHYLRLVLQQAGIEVIDCADPRDAAALVAEHTPDLLVVDLYMPGLDGLSLTMQLRRQPALALMPILFVSGEEDERARFRAIEAGADEFLRKPVRPRVLLGEVRSRIRRARRAQRHPSADAVAAAPRRRGQLRRGDFLALLGQVLREPADGGAVLMSVKIDQATPLAQRLGQAGAYALEQAVAARLASLLDDGDAYTLWLEFGFGVLVRRSRREDVVALAQALCARVAQQPFRVQDEDMALTVSIGLALPPSGNAAHDADRWFAAAYAGMSIAHRMGGNRHDGVLSASHGDMPAERVLIIREFVKNAAQGEHIEVDYQPMLPLRGAHVAGHYAQATRLRDFRAPLAGIRRDEYLDAAREAGAIGMIDRTSLFNAFESIQEERAQGRRTRILVPMDLASLEGAQLDWLLAELRRRKALLDGLLIELDAAPLLARPARMDVVRKLRDSGVTLSLSEPSGSLALLERLHDAPVHLLRLPHSAIDGVPAEAFSKLVSPWRASGRGLIVDHVRSIDAVSQLWDLGIDFLQGDALAATGPRLDYAFEQ